MSNEQSYQPIGETVVEAKEDDDRLGTHDSQCHCQDKADLLEYVDLGHFGSDDLGVGVIGVALLDFSCNDDGGKCLGHEAHRECESTTPDDVHVED